MYRDAMRSMGPEGVFGPRHDSRGAHQATIKEYKNVTHLYERELCGVEVDCHDMGVT